jgi:exonuclease III
MKIATFNINDVNKRLGNLIGWLRAEKPAVVALQELKAVDREFPKAAIEKAGYGAVWRGQKTWNGVAILARGCEPIVTRCELPGDPDVGVPANDSPMDFSAWFEAYLGGRWYTFDARYNMPRIGRILMARGRDATDVAIVTSREFQGEDRRGRVKPTVMLWTPGLPCLFLVLERPRRRKRRTGI